MEFRPCIDIHDGKVKQIVGGSLGAAGAMENFVATQDAAFYAEFYRRHEVNGGHVILLNKEGTKEYEATKAQAILALKQFPDGLQVGGGITPENALDYLRAGASKVIVTSYVFHDGQLDYENMKKITNKVGKEHLVLDLSCRSKLNDYYIVTNRWQNYTGVVLNEDLLEDLEKYAAEYLIHAVDVEGKASGIEEKVAYMLGNYNGIPVTYAGGVHSYSDLQLLKQLGKNRVNVTIGSALDLFGGTMKFEEVLDYCLQS
ncbi:MAG TPA: phosphoribosylformimino-5-aminoimidazole carboxamide ribotide isomerase [Lachnospiraceae bacterium]|nr:phosphoribosylformimino-5-aminoimidazole carboxamide ribotide isomerase [Lachnospiraceae bacterium]